MKAIMFDIAESIENVTFHPKTDLPMCCGVVMAPGLPYSACFRCNTAYDSAQLSNAAVAIRSVRNPRWAEDEQERVNNYALCAEAEELMALAPPEVRVAFIRGLLVWEDEGKPLDQAQAARNFVVNLSNLLGFREPAGNL
jgi:hypothetical protein